MKKFLLALLLLPLAVNAGDIDPDGNEILSLRYSDTSLDGSHEGLWGLSFSHIRGEDNFGFTLSVDFQNFDEKGAYIEGVGREKEEFQHYNVMGGLTYGVTENFYVMPKVGFTYSKYKHYRLDQQCALGLCQDIIHPSAKDKYRMSYGIDFMLLSHSIAYGVGLTDADYFGEREMRANLSIGYSF
ncbi:hypothetical protein [Vibrio parahaemolyticus]|uniref:hypothetical protein n=1 Tax=Vibrio parahaemolyticus TaxID=670 RepID=UPI000C9B816D|nr:hypothetical protein [Vibrio parahaemolyticus]PMS91964.1 hypothetical protein C1T06_23010 [Vibrio parahaemolyticus]